MSSVYARSRYKLLAHRAHVVICGTLLQKQFFEELFHDDHGGSSMLDAVILQRGSPTDDVLKLIYNHKMNVESLAGDPMNVIDLRRACVSQALCVFVLTNKFTRNPDQEDSSTILRALSIRRVVEREI